MFSVHLLLALPIISDIFNLSKLDGVPGCRRSLQRFLPRPLPPVTCRPSLTLAILGEDAGGDAADVLLADAVVVDLRPQAGHREDMQVAQVGEAGQPVLRIVVAGGAGKAHQTHFPDAATLVGGQLELGFGADFGEGEDLQ